MREYGALSQIENLGRGTLIGRALMAMLLTGIVAPLLFAIVAAMVFLLGSYLPRPGVSGGLSFLGVIWFFGSLVATAFAALLGLLVEWPKVKWLRSRRIWPHLFMSIAGAEILLVSAMTISTALQPPSQLSNEIGKGILLVVIAAAIGGACSAMFWWKFVMRPMRQLRDA
ncbi:hypothetical protein BH11PSE5_BH11PSE5_07880 [soil metagenome]